MGHDRGDFLVVELENVVDHFLLGVFNVAGFGTYIDHHTDFFLGNALVSMRRRDLEKLEDDVRGSRKQKNERL